MHHNPSGAEALSRRVTGAVSRLLLQDARMVLMKVSSASSRTIPVTFWRIRLSSSSLHRVSLRVVNSRMISRDAITSIGLFAVCALLKARMYASSPDALSAGARDKFGGLSEAYIFS